MTRCGKQAYLDRWQALAEQSAGADSAKLEWDGEPFCYDPILGSDEIACD